MQAEREAFLKHLEVAKQCSPSTISSYRPTLRTLEDFVTGQGITEWSAVTEETLDQFFGQLRPANGGVYAVSTKAQKTFAVRSFFRYLFRRRLVTWNPSEEFTFTRESRAPEEPGLPLTAAESEALFRALKTYHGLADPEWAVVAIGMQAGLRRAEMVHLQWEDIHFERNLIYVRPEGAKRHKPRFVKLQPSLKEFLLSRPRDQSRYVINHGRERYSKGTLDELFARLCARAGIPEGTVWLHMLRHTYAVALHDKGEDLYGIMQNMGHSDLGATQVYLKRLGVDLGREKQATLDPLPALDDFPPFVEPAAAYKSTASSSSSTKQLPPPVRLRQVPSPSPLKYIRLPRGNHDPGSVPRRRRSHWNVTLD